MSNRVKTKEAAFEVLVVGGGMTGVCAAIASARQGARTALVHERSVLGGNASSEIRMHICGASSNMTKENAEETGILREIQLENKRVNGYFNYSIWDRVLFESVKSQENLTVYLNTTMIDAEAEEGRVRSVHCYQMTTETHFRLTAAQFIDCTGNGTLAYLAGAAYRTGSEGEAEFHEPHAPALPNAERMGNTLLFKAVDRGEPVPFIKPAGAYTFTEEQLKYRKHADVLRPDGTPQEEAYCETLYTAIDKTGRELALDAYCLDYGYWWIELPGHADDIIDEYEDIRDELVKCVYGVWDHIKNGGNHGAANFDLQWVGMLPGVRESRRFIGDYILTENDVLENRVFDDAVAYGGWPVDNHTPGGLFAFDKLPSFIFSFPGLYTIPYRCYYARDVENLFIAGRILSASKLAMSSTRVMATCAVGGQAVGTAAAMCVRRGMDPRGLLPHVRELQRQLVKDDCYIPGVLNDDPGDALRAAKVTATSERPGGACALVQNGVTRETDDATNRWESDGIGPDGEALVFTLPAPKEIRQVRLAFDPNLSRSVKITLSSKRMAAQIPGVPPELVRDYDVTLFRGDAPVHVEKVRGNYQRQNIVGFAPVLCDRIEVRVLATNGLLNARIFEVRAY